MGLKITKNNYLLFTTVLAKFGVDTAKNEPLTVHLIIQSWDSIFTEPPRPAGLAALDVSYGDLFNFRFKFRFDFQIIFRERPSPPRGHGGGQGVRLGKQRQQRRQP